MHDRQVKARGARAGLRGVSDVHLNSGKRSPLDDDLGAVLRWAVLDLLALHRRQGREVVSVTTIVRIGTYDAHVVLAVELLLREWRLVHELESKEPPSFEAPLDRVLHIPLQMDHRRYDRDVDLISRHLWTHDDVDHRPLSVLLAIDLPDSVPERRSYLVVVRFCTARLARHPLARIASSRRHVPLLFQRRGAGWLTVRPAMISAISGSSRRARGGGAEEDLAVGGGVAHRLPDLLLRSLVVPQGGPVLRPAGPELRAVRIDRALLIRDRESAPECRHGFRFASRRPAIRVGQCAPQAVVDRVQLGGFAIELARLSVASL